MIETLANGTEINKEHALQYLLDDTRINVDEGYYILNIQDEGDEIKVTVDYERTESDGELQPIGKHCVFNVTYSTNSYANDFFSFSNLSQDLHDQHLEEVDEWIIDFITKKASVASGN